MNRSLLSSSGCALLIGGALIVGGSQAGAQTPQNRTETAGKPVTVVGCLSQGTESGHYNLMKASVVGGAASTGASSSTATGTSGTSAAGTTTSNPTTVTYDLMGSADLKAHLGHKVEVTGTSAAPDMHRDTAAAKEPAPRSAMGRGGSEVYGAMHVTSVKMIADTCS